MLGQAKIKENLTTKLAHHDKNIESINFELENLNSSVNDQLNFNKLLKSNWLKLLLQSPLIIIGKIPAQPIKSCENVESVTTRGRKTTHEPSYPNQGAGKEKG